VERRDGIHDDIHVERNGVYVATTAVGLYRTTEAGRFVRAVGRRTVETEA